ncbi:hypothetical protein GPB2148_469 [marine gamma proteobacterium HTCC2148]|jgi:hypothetical protein|nr:hypothetical protein GPB2148_469 [marine gamma proteobacterium HTCC2148]
MAVIIMVVMAATILESEPVSRLGAESAECTVGAKEAKAVLGRVKKVSEWQQPQ